MHHSLQIMFILPLMTGHLFWKATILGGLFRGVPLYMIFKWISMIDGWGISCEIALIWMSLDFIDDQSKLVQVMAWCHQATSHYLSQCWPRSLMPYDVTRPQWVNCSISLICSPKNFTGLILDTESLLSSVRSDSQFASSQWETVLLCNKVSHWLGAILESTLSIYVMIS